MNEPIATPGRSSAAQSLSRRYEATRRFTERLRGPLSAEDCTIQSMPDASPAKWHLAHTSWFFDTFVLKTLAPERAPFDPAFEHLFNSYYNSVGAQFTRAHRGLVTRPGLARVEEYRAWVDDQMGEALRSGRIQGAMTDVVRLGIEHEQQHQELLLMDILHGFSMNPTYPAYASRAPNGSGEPAALGWVAHAGGALHVGHDGQGFGFDNEGPRHAVQLTPFELGSRLVTNAEYLEFMDDGGYSDPLLWLSDGWARVQTERWAAPLYWVRRDDGWYEFTLHGLRPLEPAAPVHHVSLYEADAYATWAKARLPSEFEWEAHAQALPVSGRFADSGEFAPGPASGGGGAQQMFGDVWEWTRSAYAPYPGFAPAPGALGEYNGKFMCNQMVLRGGACVTPPGHVRSTYRNFFYPHQRWQFAGIRLARDVS